MNFQLWVITTVVIVSSLNLLDYIVAVKGGKSFFNHKTMKKLFLDWIRNEISFIYRNENQIMQQVSSNNLDDSGFSLSIALRDVPRPIFSLFSQFADISLYQACTKISWNEK